MSPKSFVRANLLRVAAAGALATTTVGIGLTASELAGAATCPPDAATVPFTDEVAVLLHKPGDFGTVALTEIDTVTADGTRTSIGDTGGCPDGEGDQLPLNGIGINPVDQFAYAIEDTLNYYPVGTGLIPAPNMYKVDATGRIEDTGITVTRPVQNAFPNLSGAFDYVAAYVGTFGDDGTYYTLGYNLTSFNPFTFKKGPIDWYLADVDVNAGTVSWRKVDTSDALCATIAEDFRVAYGTSRTANVGPIADWVYSGTSVLAIDAEHQAQIRIDTNTAVAACSPLDNQLTDPASAIVGMATLGLDTYVVNAAGQFGTFDGTTITEVTTIGAINGDMGSNNLAPLQWDLQLSIAGQDAADRTGTLNADADTPSSIDVVVTNQGEVAVASAVIRVTKPDGSTIDVDVAGPIAVGGTSTATIPIDGAAAGTYEWTFEIVSSVDADGIDRTFYDVDSLAGSGFDAADGEDDAVELSVVVAAATTTTSTTTTSTTLPTVSTTSTTVGPTSTSTTTSSTTSTSTTVEPQETTSTSGPEVLLPTTTSPRPTTDPPVTGSNSGIVALFALLMIGCGLVIRGAARNSTSRTS